MWTRSKRWIAAALFALVATFAHADGILNAPPSPPYGATALTIPTTALKAVYSILKVNNWAGSCVRVQRADTTQSDIGFAGNVCDKAAADTFAAGTALTVTKWYDQSGNGLDLVQSTDANRPVFTALNEWHGLRLLTFDGWPTATNPKFMDTPALTGIDRNTLSVYMMVEPRAPNQATEYFEGFSDSFTTTAAYFIGASGSMGAQFGGGFVTNNKYPRAHLQTLSVVSNGTNIRFRFDGDDKTIATGATSLALASMRFGKLSVNSNYHASHGIGFVAIYAQNDLAAANLTVENALNASFNPDRAASGLWKNQLIVDGSSLETGYFATELQQSDWQGGWSRGLQLVDWEYFNMAIGGTTLATANSTKTRVTGLLNGAYVKRVVSAPAPSNDIAGTTYTGTVDAQTGNANAASVIYNNQLIPYVQAMIAAGVTRVIVPTVIPRTGWDTTTNWRETARVAYNALVISGAAANGYVVADMGAIPQLQTFDSTYYASDNIHLKPAGYVLMENVRKPLVLNFLLERDLDPASNDNSPMWQEKAA